MLYSKLNKEHVFVKYKYDLFRDMSERRTVKCVSVHVIHLVVCNGAQFWMPLPHPPNGWLQSELPFEPGRKLHCSTPLQFSRYEKMWQYLQECGFEG